MREQLKPIIMKNERKTELMSIHEWTTNRWCILSEGQIVYYANDETDARQTLAQWGAAPELLEALKEISKVGYPKEDNSGPTVYVKLQKIAAEAIKKATT